MILAVMLHILHNRHRKDPVGSVELCAALGECGISLQRGRRQQVRHLHIAKVAYWIL